MSKRIQRLEEELGQRLLRRGRGGVEATAAGRLVAEAARAMLAEEDRLRHRLGVLEGADLQGAFVLGASTIPGEYLAPAFLARCGSGILVCRRACKWPIQPRWWNGSPLGA